MTEMRSAGTLGDVLAARRRRRFVGRASEMELFRVALDSAEPPFSMLHVHGPAGIGKTSLLDAFAELAADAGASVVRLDGRDLLPSPPAVLDALRGVLHVPDGEGAIAGPPDTDRLVVLLDTYERLAPLDDWVRTRLLPRLPATALTVAAGRIPPGSAWRADPAWRELLRVVSLRNLNPEESRRYLHACGVDPARHDQLVEITHGHPLGLSLLADVVARGGEATADPLTPDLVGTLLRQFVEVVPGGLHRRVLEVCALARVTTEALLREALGLEDAHELFAWLRKLSFVDSGPDGLFPHDLARDALEADLRWRDPDGYRRVFRGIRAHIHGRLKSTQGHQQQHAISDAKFLFRHETIRDAEPLDDPVPFRFPASVRHRYERLDRFPDGLLVVGDAVASFNPIYGQGMSVAALEALTLRHHLERGAAPQPRRFFRDLPRVVDAPWDIAAGGDLVFPGVQGRRTLKARVGNAYIARLHAAAAHDASLASAFVRVAGLVAPPQALLRPGVALRVLRGSLRRTPARTQVAVADGAS